MSDNRWEAFSDKELGLIATATDHYTDGYLAAYPAIFREVQDELTLRRGRREREELMTKVRMKVTITGYYEADPAHYGDKKDNPAAMARVDESYFQEDGLSAYESIESGFTITVEPA